MRALSPRWFLVFVVGCASHAGAPLDMGSSAPPTQPSAPSVLPTTSDAPATTAASAAPPVASSAETIAAPAELLLPAGTASALEGVTGFDAVRKGKVLRLGTKSPAVTVVQTMLLAWGYPLGAANVTGTFDEATAIAVLHYRIDFGLSEFKGSGSDQFAKFAKTEGRFDEATLKNFEGRLRATNYRWIRAVDLDRGLRFEVPVGTSPASALAAIFPDDATREKAKALGATVRFDEPTANIQPGWIGIAAYACASSPRERCATK